MHREQFIFFFVVLAGLCCFINSAYPEGEIIWSLLLDCDSYALIAFSYLVTRMFETYSLTVICSFFFVNLCLTKSTLFKLQEILVLVLFG